MISDATIKISIWLICGGNTIYYPWNKSDHFAKGDNAYNVVAFENSDDFYDTSIEFGGEMTPEFWQGKTCYLDFRFGKNANKVSATFDDFQIVYPED